MSHRVRDEREGIATPEYVAEYIGEPENGYHKAMKMLAGLVAEPVEHPHSGAFDPAPENTVTPEEIAATIDTPVSYVTREFVGEFIRSNLVYYNGEEYVMLPRSEESFETALDRTEDYELSAVERAFIRVDEWLLEQTE